MPNCAVPGTEPSDQPAGQRIDPALAEAVDVARAAAALEAGAEQVGTHVGVDVEDAPGPAGSGVSAAATHLFDTKLPGYRGWRWAVTVASAGPDTPVTVSEVVLLPGQDALVAPEWLPWQYRVRPGDLGVGDLMPTTSDDPRLVPGYLASDDPAVEEVAMEAGLGRPRVLSRFGRLDAADRWQGGDFGPLSDMARSAPDRCGRCGFYVPLGGSLRAAFGVCGNELSPADGRAVHAEYGCGAHSEVELDTTSPVPVADLVYDDTTLDVEPVLVPSARTETRPADADDSSDEVPAEPEPDEVPAQPEPDEVPSVPDGTDGTDVTDPATGDTDGGTDGGEPAGPPPIES